MALPIQTHSPFGRETQDPYVPQAAPPEETDYDQFVPVDLETQRSQAHPQGHTQETHADCHVQLSVWMAREDAGAETWEETVEEAGGEGVELVYSEEIDSEVSGVQKD